MSFNIQTFKSNINSFGYLQDYLFEVVITNPNVLLNESINLSGTPERTDRIAQNMKFRIEQVRAPGIALLMGDIARYGIGPTQKMPFNAAYSNEITLSVLSDKEGQIWQYWHLWLRSIFEFNGVENTINLVRNAPANFNTAYKDEYSTTIEIIVYDKTKKVAQKIKLLEAFPTSMRDTQFSWGASDLLRFAVSITYSSYIIEGASIIDTLRGPSSR